MATNEFTDKTRLAPRLATLPSTQMAEPPQEVTDALARLAEAQSELERSIEAELRLADPASEIDVLLNEAQVTADQIVERAELEAFTIRRLMKIETERLVANVERLKERAQRLENKFS
jgi:hypothetical protein